MLHIAELFALQAPPVSCTPYGHGHINATYLLVDAQAHRYILQRINTGIFTNPVALMENIAAVTGHLQAKLLPGEQALHLVPTRAGNAWLSTHEGFFRVYDFVEDSVCLEQATSPEDFYQSALAFGLFQQKMDDFPADTLHETIPRFHDTKNRFRQLFTAIQANPLGRVQAVQGQIEALCAFEPFSSTLTDALARKQLPLRVTHNDTKLNNVLLRQGDKSPLCIIDLDTVMPGLVAYDFGDSIRFGASTAAEDEPDPSKVSLSRELFATYAKGFLQGCGKQLTPAELRSLSTGAIMLTLENAVRFLTDHINGDVYYKISHPNHNLDRCNTQIALLHDMKRQEDWMQKTVEDAAKL